MKIKSVDAQVMQSVLGPLSEWPDLDLELLVAAISQHGQRCIRPRPGIEPADLPFESLEVPWSVQGRFLHDSRIRPGGLLAFAAGDYAVQDAASLLPLSLMQIQPGQAICDCCAAPGGKSAAVLERLNGSGWLLSNEVIASRVDTLQLTLARTGFSNYVIMHQPVASLTEVVQEMFDCVLVDAPCTGQTLVGRGKQSLSAFSATQIAHSAARQQSILRHALELVRPGGRLIYSTCTFAFEENEAIVAWLRSLLPDWQPVLVESLTDWAVPGYAGCYRVWPDRDHCAGGFAAGLERPHDASLPSQQHDDDLPALRSTWTPYSDSTIFDQWGSLSPNGGQLWLGRHTISWFDQQVASEVTRLAWSGIELANQFGDHWQPAYPLATLSDAGWFQPRVATELSDSEAIAYMSGASLHRDGPAGWQVVHWRGRPLGWAKQVGTQLKNHLPKPLRQPVLKVS